MVRRGDDAPPRVEYLETAVPATARLLALAGAASAAAIFRATAPCAESRCGHFDGQGCRLGARVRQHLPLVTAEIPACAIRAACRWYAEQGAAVCHRCAWVVTESPDAGEAADTMRWIADPDSRPATGSP